MRFYCNKKYFKYFEDYLNTLKKSNDKYIFYDDTDTIIKIFNDNITNIFVSTIPDINKIKIFRAQDKKNINIFLLNTEQLSRDDYKNILIENINKIKILKEKYKNIKIGIIDYSIENTLILKKDFNDLCINYIPYQYLNSEINKLINFSKIKTSNISLIDTDSIRRNKIVEQIESKNINIDKIRGWHDTRDIKIGKSKILLNIHMNTNYHIYESLRCDRWIFSGQLIISENCFSNDILDIKDFIIFEEYDKLADKAFEVLKNYENYLNINIQSKQKLNQIIENRKSIYDDFRKIYN